VRVVWDGVTVFRGEGDQGGVFHPLVICKAPCLSHPFMSGGGPTAAATTAALQASMRTNDVMGGRRAMHKYVYGGLVFHDNDRQQSIDAIIAAVETWKHEARFVGAACCALYHVSGLCRLAPVPINPIVDATRRNLNQALVVAASLKLLAVHTALSMEELPAISSIVADAMKLHPTDDNIAHYGGFIIIRYAAIDSKLIAKEHGSLRLEQLMVASLTAALHCQVNDTHLVAGMRWCDHISTILYPRLRPL
jgi:hypothetical protein